MESSTINSTNMKQELDTVVALMETDLMEYELALRSKQENEADATTYADAATKLVVNIKETTDAARIYCSKILGKARLLLPKKEVTEALVDKISDSRKRKRDEEEEPEKDKKLVIVKVHVPAEKMAFVAGKYYSNKERLEKKYRIRVHIPQRGGKEVELKGPAHRVAAAKEDILVNLPVDQKHVVDKRFVGSIIGRNGQKINELRRRHKVKIDVKYDNEVNISGSLGRCDAAWKDIRAIIDRCKRDEEDRLQSDWYFE